MTPKTNKNLLKTIGRGALGGGALGAIGGASYEPEGKYRPNLKDRLKNTAIGGLAGGLAGAAAGGHAFGKMRTEDIRNKQRTHRGWKFGREQRRAAGEASAEANLHTHHKTIGLTGNEKTKAEVSKIFKKKAFEAHPDRQPGKSDEAMKNLNRAHGEVKKSDWFKKLAGCFSTGFEAIHTSLNSHE